MGRSFRTRYKRIQNNVSVAAYTAAIAFRFVIFFFCAQISFILVQSERFFEREKAICTDRLCVALIILKQWARRTLLCKNCVDACELSFSLSLSLLGEYRFTVRIRLYSWMCTIVKRKTQLFCYVCDRCARVLNEWLVDRWGVEMLKEIFFSCIMLCFQSVWFDVDFWSTELFF